MIYSTAFEINGINFLVQADPEGISAVHFSPKKNELSRLQIISPASKHFFGIHAQLKEYFNQKRTKFDIPVSFKGNRFGADVYKAMRKIPFGKYKTYGELAEAAGSPKAFRAVGNICGANKVPIIIPCHRVLASGGKLGGYSGGLDIKRELLRIEGISYRE